MGLVVTHSSFLGLKKQRYAYPRRIGISKKAMIELYIDAA